MVTINVSLCICNSLANTLPPRGATAQYTPNEGQDSTGNKGVVYDEISRSARQRNAGDVATTGLSNIELKTNAAYGSGNIELKANEAYQVQKNKH